MTTLRSCLLPLFVVGATGCQRDVLAAITPPDFAPGLALDASEPGSDLTPDECRRLEVDLTPAASNLQVVVWLEDAGGRVVDTLFITEATGRRGLGNRPGVPLLNSGIQWPYGKREMVAPVWAHRRDHHYRRIVMGAACPYAPVNRCPGAPPCFEDCDERNIIYLHAKTSDRFYCNPLLLSGNPPRCVPDGQTVKGIYDEAPAFSLYPPRADVRAEPTYDSPDVGLFAADNDLVAVSGATPAANAPLHLDIRRQVEQLPDGEYHLWVEVSAESDFNASHRHPGDGGSIKEWEFLGHEFLGQPSVLYHVALKTSLLRTTFTSDGYAGYGAWDGTDGALRPPDGTITTDQVGSGAGRLVEQGGRGDRWQVRVIAGGCSP